MAGAVALLAFLALLWPLVRSPAMGVAAADAFLFAAWAVLIAALATIAWAGGPAAPRERSDDDA